MKKHLGAETYSQTIGNITQHIFKNRKPNTSIQKFELSGIELLKMKQCNSKYNLHDGTFIQM